LDTSERTIDFTTDEVDILITYAGGVAAHGTIDAHLLEDKRVPVAAPSLINKMGGSSAGATSIAGWPLLHDESEVSWRQWFSQVGRSDVDAVSGSNFSDHALMIDAAADGHGAALASAICADPYLRTGVLVALEGPCIPQAAYRIYCDLRSYEDDQVRRVYEWFIREAESSESAMAMVGV
jgi:LysR family glycine cleavage system transcriptional activator